MTSSTSSTANSVKTRNRKPSVCNPFQEAAMKLDRLPEQKVDSDDFYCCPKSIQNIEQRLFPLQKIYDCSKHSGFDHDRAYIARNINGTGTIKPLNCNLTQTQPEYANIPDSNNGAEGFIHECDNSLQYEWPVDEDSRTETIESKIFS